MKKLVVSLVCSFALLGCGGGSSSSSPSPQPQTCLYNPINGSNSDWELDGVAKIPAMADVMSIESEYCPDIISTNHTDEENSVSFNTHPISHSLTVNPQFRTYSFNKVRSVESSNGLFDSFEFYELSYRKEDSDFDLDNIQFRHYDKSLNGGSYVYCTGEVRHYGLDMTCTFTDTWESYDVPANFMDDFYLLSDEELAKGDYLTVLYNKVEKLR